jgi:filamentous hemagglutinin
LPPALQVTAFSGDVDIVGNLILCPSPTGTVDLLAAGSINGLQPNGITTVAGMNTVIWGSSLINLSDANPADLPGINSPYGYQVISGVVQGKAQLTATDFLSFLNPYFSDSGSTVGTYGVLQTQQALHDAGLLHLNDPSPMHIYAGSGDASGFTLFSSKVTDVIAGGDITNVALYIQNNNAANVSMVVAGGDIIAYDPNSPALVQARSTGNTLVAYNSGVALPASQNPNAGDIQIAGPGTIEVLAGHNLDLGVGPGKSDGTGAGLVSIGNNANPYLPFDGADIIAGAGIGGSFGLANSQLDFSAFISRFLDPTGGGNSYATRYLPDLAKVMGLKDGTSNSDVWTDFKKLSAGQQDILALDIFYLVLRDAGRDHNDSSSPGFGNYDAGKKAITALFPDGNTHRGDVLLTSREIKTENGGNISIFAPGGQLTVGLQVAGTQAADQGILTQDGGNISIFTDGNVNVGTSRIFTLRGGNEIIWSSNGNIAAGASSKTVQSAPPTRVLINPQSGDVEIDLAGLATGGGIGVLATVAGVPPGDVDLIAPTGTIDAGDAGIRSSEIGRAHV